MKKRIAAGIATMMLLGIASACSKPAEPTTKGTAPQAPVQAHPEWEPGKSIEMAMVSYAGPSQEPHKFFLVDLLEKKYPGLKIRLVPSESQDVVAQIKASATNPPYDLMPNGEPPHLQMIADGLLAKLDASKVPNLKEIYPEFVQKSQGYGVPATYSLIGIAYNAKTTKTPPKSWKDLWNPEFSGKVGLVAPTSNLGLGFLVAAAKAHGGDEKNLQPGFDAIKKLGKVTVAPNPTALAQLLERGEIDVAPLWSTDAAVLANKGASVKFVKPEPGAIAIISFVSGIENGKYPALTAELLNNLLSEEYQTKAAAKPYYFGPTNKNVKVPAEAAEYIPATPDEVRKLQTVDWPTMVPKRQEINDTWKKMFSN